MSVHKKRTAAKTRARTTNFKSGFKPPIRGRQRTAAGASFTGSLPTTGGGSRPAGQARVGLQEHAPGTPQTRSFLQTLKEFLPKKLGF